MVKNIGGNQAKRQARKHTQGSNLFTTRKAMSDDEKYSIVTKLYGGGRAEIKSIDGVTRIMIIRKKFKGRNKRDNNVMVNSWVLAGLRSWEAKKPDNKETCDLLEVYSSNNVEELKQSVDAAWYVLMSSCKSTSDQDQTTELDFTDERTQKYEDLLNSGNDTEKITDTLDWLTEDGGESGGNHLDFDIDDI
jgi:hypothetical protein